MTPTPAGTSPSDSRVWRRLLGALPRGRHVTDAAFERRHRAVIGVLAALLPVWVAVGFRVLGSDGLHDLAVTGLIGLVLLVSWQPRWSRRTRESLAALGVVLLSAQLIHLTGGLIESHFFFFIGLPLMMVYEAWRPLLITLAATVFHHAVTGVIAPEQVYNHAAAQAHPVRWALIHGGAVLLAAAAQIAMWKLTEEGHRVAAQTLDASKDPLYGLDADGRILYANRALCELLQLPSGAIVGRTDHELLHPPVEGECSLCSSVAAGDGMVPDEPALVVGERSFPVDLAAHAIVERGQRVGTAVTFRDVTRRVEQERLLADMAMRDALTGLPNRRRILEQLEAELSAVRRGAPLAILFLDLDGFKAVNDRLGHAAGDQLLRQVSHRIVDACRGEDLVGRLGGDEFVVLVRGDRDAALQLAERLVEKVAAPYDVAGADARVGASIGLRVCSPDDDDPDDVLAAADQAMYVSKEAGRGRVTVFDPVHVVDDADARSGR